MKKTGVLLGFIEGRVHGQDHAKMWMGDRKETIRLVIQYKKGEEVEKEVVHRKQIGMELDKDGFYMPIYETKKIRVKEFTFDPDIEGDDQKNMIKEIEAGAPLTNYKLDIATKKLVKIA